MAKFQARAGRIFHRTDEIRKENRALQLYDNLRFYPAENEAILFYGKMTAARDNIILVVVNLDPHRKQHSYVDVPIDQFGQMETDAYEVHDLLNDARYIWRGRRNYVELDPDIQTAHIFRVRRCASSDRFVWHATNFPRSLLFQLSFGLYK